MDIFEISTLMENRVRSGQASLEFFGVPALSMTIYVLPAHGVDPQQPHVEDEIYYIVRGRAQIRVGTEDRPVQPGTIVYVAAEVEHRFHTIDEDLTAFVVFAPARTRGPAQARKE